MKIIISNSSNAPIYEQIKEQIKSAILSGEIKETEMLPSIRTLAKELKISAITTTRAYSDLEQEGFIKTMQGKGCFVLPTNTQMMKESVLREVEESILSAAKIARMAGLTRAEFQHIVDFILKEEELYE
ncbi:MAG: GntR family transcriptional regulator [Clostridium sp.]